VVLAARRYDLLERRVGRRNGPLGHVALEVLELLGHLVSYKTGQLDPSIDTLMRTLRRSRDAVVRALAALKAHGFLDWLRRYEPTGREGRGPQVRQASNAYRLSLPARALRLLGRLLQAPPLPDDVSHAQEQRRAETAAHKADLPLEELPLFEVEDSALSRVLASLGRSVQERESARRPESQAQKNA
jgi:DNA-binding transcriptional MocR family regulator